LAGAAIVTFPPKLEPSILNFWIVDVAPMLVAVKSSKSAKMTMLGGTTADCPEIATVLGAVIKECDTEILPLWVPAKVGRYLT